MTAMPDTKTPYEQLQEAIAAEPEGATVAIDGAGNVTVHPPLSQDESEYGQRMRELLASFADTTLFNVDASPEVQREADAIFAPYVIRLVLR